MRKFLNYLAFVAESLRFVTPLRIALPMGYEQKKHFCQKYHSFRNRKKTGKALSTRTKHK